MHDHVIDYPTFQQFVQAAPIVIAKIRGQSDDDWACVINAAWCCQGYAQSHIPHDHPPMVGKKVAAKAPPKMGAKTVANHLEKAVAQKPGKLAMGAEAIPWAIIIPVLVQLITEWLKRRK